MLRKENYPFDQLRFSLTLMYENRIIESNKRAYLMGVENFFAGIMLSADTVNAGFEIGSGFFTLNHCRVLYNDKIVRGVSLASIFCFVAWGVWNIFYYPSLGQYNSAYAAVFILLANFAYLSLIFFYRRMEKMGSSCAAT